MTPDINSIDFTDDELSPGLPNDLRGLSEEDDGYDQLAELATQSAEALVAHDEFPEADVTEVAEALISLSEYLTGPELLRGVTEAFAPDDDSQPDSGSSSTSSGEYDTVSTEQFESNSLDGDTNVDLDGELLVTDVSDHDSDSIALVATVGDHDGSFRLTVFQTSYDKEPETFAPLAEGNVITAEGLTTDEYNGYINAKAFVSAEFEVVSDPTLEASEADAIADDTVEVTGPISEIRSKYSGLVKECPTDDCRRTVTDGQCPDCGTVDFDSFTLQIAGVVDADTSKNFYIDEDAVSEFVGLSVEEVEQEARRQVNQDWLDERLSQRLTSRYIRVEGTESGAGNISVTDFNLVTSPPDDIGDNVSKYARDPEPRFSADSD